MLIYLGTVPPVYADIFTQELRRTICIKPASPLDPLACRLWPNVFKLTEYINLYFYTLSSKIQILKHFCKQFFIRSNAGGGGGVVGRRVEVADDRR